MGAAHRQVAIVTGGSKGLGRALVGALVAGGWQVVFDGRDAGAVARAEAEVGQGATGIAGDVTDADHRAELVQAAWQRGGLDLLVNNAGTLGPTPLPALADLDPAAFAAVLCTNVVAPLALTQEALPQLRARGGLVVNVSSDAAVEPYEGWGAYGASKAALAQWTRVLDAEEPDVRVVAVDPGDMRTDMHQAAFPGEDISDRPLPEVRLPRILELLVAEEVR